MRGHTVSILCALIATVAAAAGPESRPADPNAKVVAEIRARLLREFEGHLRDPKAYARVVRAQCGRFPEGDLFPYVLPARAYAHLAVAEPKHKPLARKRIAQCIELTIPGVVRRVRPPGGKLENLRAFDKNGTYLGQLNLALGYYRLVGGDGRYEKVHKRVSDVLHAALVQRRGRPIESYPRYSWTYDTIPCLVSLSLRDKASGGSQAVDVTRRHLEWLRRHGTDKATGLPYHRWDPKTRKAFGSPRGCDISPRLALLSLIDRPYARRMYKDYVKHHWIDRQVVAGFAEWPGGRLGPQDLDSGPVVMGVGMTASGMGIAAARAMNDGPRLGRLCAQMADMKQLLPLMLTAGADGRRSFAGMIPYRPEYVTGFLFGDACLFYAVTWPERRVEGRG